MFRLAPALAAFVAVLFPTPLLHPVNASTELAEGLYTTSYDLTNLATLSKHVWHMVGIILNFLLLLCMLYWLMIYDALKFSILLGDGDGRL